MSTRKKAPKKASSRSATAIHRSSKSSSTSKAKDTKTSVKIGQPARPAKKAAAKAGQAANRSSANGKKKTERSKASRIAAVAKAPGKGRAKTTKSKTVSAAKVRRTRSSAPHAQEGAALGLANTKSESNKKGPDKLPLTGHAKTNQSKTQTADGGQSKAGEAAKSVGSPAAVIGLDVASATPKPSKSTAAEKPPVAETEETVTQKTAKGGGNRHGFKTNEFIVYPAHGVGQIVAVEEQEVAGFRLELFVITFVKDKMTLRVPTGKVAGVGMRKLAEPDVVRKALDILLGRARIKRTMWSRRAQEYETKINSGDLAAISEVVRDLYRSEAQPEQSYSERQLYEAALDRMAREVSVVQKLSESEALKAIDAQLQKGQRRGAKTETDVAAPSAGETDVEEAA